MKAVVPKTENIILGPTYQPNKHKHQLQGHVVVLAKGLIGFRDGLWF